MRSVLAAVLLLTAISAALPAGPGAPGAGPVVASNPATDTSAGDPAGVLVAIPGSREPAPPFVIDRPGSYRLEGNRLCQEDGIRVNADDVTIDLGGFSLTGPDSGESVGIRMNSRRNIEIRNGTIRDFGKRGIHEKNDSLTAAGKRILDVRVISNGSCGICLGGSGNLVRGCFVEGNGGTGTCSGGLIEGNVYLNNETGGIAAGDGARVVGNTISATRKTGIFARSGCTIQNNVVSDADNSGIYAEFGCLIEGNVVSASNRANVDGYAGVKVMGDCIVRGNTARGNWQANFYFLRSGNTVEGNLATAPADTLGDGFRFRMKENHFAGNQASGNRTDFAGEVPAGPADSGNISLPHREPAPVNP